MNAKELGVYVSLYLCMSLFRHNLVTFLHLRIQLINRIQPLLRLLDSLPPRRPRDLKVLFADHAVEDQQRLEQVLRQERMCVQQLFPRGRHGGQVVRGRIRLDVFGHGLLVPGHMLCDQGLRLLERGLDLEDQGVLLGVAVGGQDLDVVFLLDGGGYRL